MTLPNFLIIGAARSGTSSLYHWLGQHPQIYMSPFKEPRYFAREGIRPDNTAATRTREEYEAQFAGVRGEKAIGEASPQYLPSLTAPGRIAGDIPDAKLIVSLRNPIDRAYSHWLHRVRRAGESRPAARAIQPGDMTFDESLYAASLRRYLALFPRENLRILVFDDLVSAPGDTVRGLLEFLDVDASVPVRTDMAFNDSRSPRSLLLTTLLHQLVRFGSPLLPRRFRGRGLIALAQKPLFTEREPIDPALRQRLASAFRDDVRETSEIVGRDLTGWLREATE